MNNEDKILSMLETLITKVDNLESDVKDLKQGQAKLESKVDNLEQGQIKIQKDIMEIKHVQAMDTGTIESILGEVVKINNKIDSVSTETKQNTYVISNIKKAIQ